MTLAEMSAVGICSQPAVFCQPNNSSCFPSHNLRKLKALLAAVVGVVAAFANPRLLAIEALNLLVHRLSGRGPRDRPRSNQASASYRHVAISE
jgi:hypothetical protein